ncbi:hypothetical protein C8Q80DRAFT_1238634 [Daedaleopsis nitida]|nr:hypothetical protein C8Q80DRAFT_1238634 [Daedaleopsis nitida]
MVIVNISGVHELPIAFCTCHPHRREDPQLLEMSLYPATRTRLQTMFPRRLLDDFLLANKEMHTSPRNYFNKLRRMTNTAFPHMSPVKLLRVSRQWRNLKARKWNSYGYHDEEPGPGDLAVLCPACLQPGLNLPDNWQEDPQKFKYTQSVVLDGNFSAQHRQMKNPEDDVALADGHSYMVTEASYKAHLKSAMPAANVYAVQNGLYSAEVRENGCGLDEVGYRSADPGAPKLRSEADRAMERARITC